MYIYICMQVYMYASGVSIVDCGGSDIERVVWIGWRKAEWLKVCLHN